MNLRKMVRYWRKSSETWGIVAHQLGWQRSFLEGRPVDKDGEPVPWYTYPAIEFIRSLDFSKSRVFEYGCGNSSLFWAKNAYEVFAVENSSEWARLLEKFKVPNLVVIEANDRKQYIQTPINVGGTFDVVVIDGRHRQACASVACGVVNQGGMIVFDNADWYPDACDDLREQGWFQIDFSGLGPINSYSWTTAVFLKTSTVFERYTNAAPVGGNPSGAI